MYEKETDVMPIFNWKLEYKSLFKWN